MSDRHEPLPNDELISAYHDGELTGADLERAEALLASDPECRQLLEELRAISSGLGSIPRRELGPDFPRQVLRRAEREMLTPPARSTDSAPDDSLTDASLPAVLRWPRGRRPWMWAATAVAAALTMMLFVPPQSKNAVRQVAQQSKEQSQPQDLSMSAVHAGGGSGGGAKFKTDLDLAGDPQPAAAAITTPAASALDSEVLNARPLEGTISAIPGASSPLGTAAAGKPAETDGFSLPVTNAPVKAVELQARSNLPTKVSDGILVIDLEMNASAANEDFLAMALGSNGIVLDDRKSDVGSFRDQESNQRAAGGKAAAEEPSELVYVVATQAQLRGTLEQLQANGQIKLSWRADENANKQTWDFSVNDADAKNTNRPAGKAEGGAAGGEKAQDDDRSRKAPGNADPAESRDGAARSGGGSQASPEAKTAMGREASPQPLSENAPFEGRERREKFEAEKSLDAEDKADVSRRLDQPPINGSLTDQLGKGGGGSLTLGAAAPQGRAKRLASPGNLLKQIESGEFKTLTPAEALNSVKALPPSTPAAEPAKPKLGIASTEKAAEKENVPPPAAAPTTTELPATISGPKDRATTAEDDPVLAKKQRDGLEKLNETLGDGPAVGMLSQDELDRPVPTFQQALFVIRIVSPSKAADSKPTSSAAPASPPSSAAPSSVPPAKSP